MNCNVFRNGYLSCRACAPLLVGYAEMQLDAGRRARVEAHLSLCRACSAKLAEIVEVASVLQSTQIHVNGVGPDLWPAMEATIRATAQEKAGWSLVRPSVSGFRKALLGDSGWGQALPIGATVFAAGILILVVVDGARHSAKNSANATLAVVRPQDAEESVDAKPGMNKAAMVPASAAGDKLAERSFAETKDAPEYGAHVQIASRAEDSVSAHGATRRSYRSGSSRRRAGSAEIAGTDIAQRIAEVGNQFDGAQSAASHGRRAMSPHESGTSRHSQIAVVAEKPKDNAERDSILPAPVRFGAFGTSPGISGGRSSSVVASVSPSRGSYAAEDDTDSNVSFADASGSIRRQQKLFSY